MKNTVRMARSAFDEQFVLADWRILSYSLIAQFVATSFLEARHFVDDVVGAAESLDHHPDIDIRYPGTVRITLTTHAVNGLTELDANLAATISELATQQLIVAIPARVALLDVAIDALNIAAIIPFWKAILGYIDEPPANPGESVDAIMDPLRIGPPFWFQQMDNPRPQRNRIHFDLKVPHDVAEERITQAVAAGGRLLNSDSARAFWVLADPEGNEICICTWQDRD
jgi:4a-hydroxytetrahydrobiopterin dehydratase